MLGKLLCFCGVHSYYKFFDTIQRCSRCGKQIGEEYLEVTEND